MKLMSSVKLDIMAAEHGLVKEKKTQLILHLSAISAAPLAQSAQQEHIPQPEPLPAHLLLLGQISGPPKEQQGQRIIKFALPVTTNRNSQPPNLIEDVRGMSVFVPAEHQSQVQTAPLTEQQLVKVVMLVVVTILMAAIITVKKYKQQPHMFHTLPSVL